MPLQSSPLVASVSRTRVACKAASAALFAAFLALGTAATAQSVATTPVGAINYTVSASSDSPSLNFLGFPLLSPPIGSAKVVSISGSVVSVSTNALSGVTLSGPAYLLVESGVNQGLSVDILSVSASQVNLAESVADMISAEDTFSIRSHWTISSLFGASNSVGLGGASTISNADEIRIFNPVTQTFVSYYYKNGGVGGVGWRASGSSADRSSDIVYPEQSIVIVRKQASPLSFTIIGEVHSKIFRIPLEAGINWVLNTAPKEFTLGSIGFYTGSADGIQGASTIGNADEVMRWTGSSWERFFYKNGGVGGTGWRSSSTGSTDRSGQIIAPGEVLVINRKSSPVLIARSAFATSSE